MEAVAHDPDFAKKAGVPQSVGQEFSEADKAKNKIKSQKEMMKKRYKE